MLTGKWLQTIEGDFIRKAQKEKKKKKKRESKSNRKDAKSERGEQKEDEKNRSYPSCEINENTMSPEKSCDDNIQSNENPKSDNGTPLADIRKVDNSTFINTDECSNSPRSVSHSISSKQSHNSAISSLTSQESLHTSFILYYAEKRNCTLRGPGHVGGHISRQLNPLSPQTANMGKIQSVSFNHTSTSKLLSYNQSNKIIDYKNRPPMCTRMFPLPKTFEDLDPKVVKPIKKSSMKVLVRHKIESLIRISDIKEGSNQYIICVYIVYMYKYVFL
jgi:hypothetical protein